MGMNQRLMCLSLAVAQVAVQLVLPAHRVAQVVVQPVVVQPALPAHRVALVVVQPAVVAPARQALVAPVLLARLEHWARSIYAL